jgi:hypothetical protein
MAVTSNTYTANGTNKLFSITFPYLDTSDIDVSVNGVLQTITTQYFFANATTVEFVTAPANGATVLLNRSTDDTALQATFFPGSSIKASDLNYNFDQVLFLSQETANSAANQSTAGLQAQITAANNTSNTALTTANAAEATANGIAGTANTALTNANAAVVTANAANATAIAADATANGIAATANTALANSSTALTAANAALPLAGGTMTGVITYATAQPRLVRETAKAYNWNGLTTNTSIDFTSIPSWVKRLTVVFHTLSLSGSAYGLIQLGDSGGVETTGYTSSANYLQGGLGSGNVSSTAGIILINGVNVNQLTGSVVFNNINSNTWVATGMWNYSQASGTTAWTAGDKTLSGTLDRIRITSDNGTDTFDLGTVNIIYEG